jgi:DNA-binding NarL/FixJ family response regulator
VGETKSLSALCRRAFEEGVPTAAVIVGDPGSGKSRLLAEVASLVEVEDRVVIAGYELEHGVELAAARELLCRLGDVPGETVGALAFGAPDGRIATEPIRLFEAAHKAMGTLGPMLIVVDDLHWVDDMSVALLHYLLRAANMSRQPVALVIASRRAPVAATFADSLRSVLGATRVETIELGPLDREAGVRLAREVAPQLDETRASALWEAASGSPFWLELLATSDDADADLVRVVSDRLCLIAADEAAVLAVLVVAARPMTLDDLAGIQGWPRSRIERTSPALERHGLVQLALATVTVAHDLIRDAVASTLTAAQTRGLHDRISSWLERTGNDDVQVLLQALEHRHRAGKPVAVLAARLAASPGRLVLGSAGFERLVAIGDAADTIDPAYGELHAALAAMASALGRHDDALRRWAERGIVAADPVEAARAELRASEAALALGRRRAARHHLERARRAAPNDQVLAIEVLAQDAALRQFVDHQPEESRAAAEEAVAAARAFMPRSPRAGHHRWDELDERVRRAVLRALFAGLQGAQFADDPEQMLRFADELTVAATGFDDAIRIGALVDGALALRFQGRNIDAVTRLREAWVEVHRHVLPQSMLEVGAALGTVALSMAHVAEADAVARECLALDTRLAGFRSSRSFSLVLPHLVELSRGDWRAAVQGLGAAAAGETEPHYRQHAHRERATALARLDPVHAASEVRDSVDAALADAEVAACRRCLAEATCRGAEALARVSQTDAARSLLDGAVIPSADAHNGFWRRRAEAALATATDDASRVAPALDAVITAAESQSLHLEAVWARLDLGAVLAGFDRPRAAAVLRTAGAVAERAGAVTEGRLADQQLRALGVRTWRRASASAGDGRLASLTSREREIAGLVAGGASNPEIAAAVFLSRKTVERHLSNIFAKAGVRNRAELAVLAADETTERRAPGRRPDDQRGDTE